jgi:hypothetical protein
MGDVLGGTRSGSAQGSLYWGTARGLISLPLSFESRKAAFYVAFRLFLYLSIGGLQRISIVEQFDPAINIHLALRLKLVELLLQRVGGEDPLS